MPASSTPPARRRRRARSGRRPWDSRHERGVSQPRCARRRRRASARAQRSHRGWPAHRRWPGARACGGRSRAQRRRSPPAGDAATSPGRCPTRVSTGFSLGRSHGGSRRDGGHELGGLFRLCCSSQRHEPIRAGGANRSGQAIGSVRAVGIARTSGQRPPRQHSSAPPTAGATLVITASRTASWLEVRAGDSTGEQLFFGMLEEGATSEFEQLPVWVTLGAAEGVERLAGSRISSLPIGENGVVQFIASEEGVAVPAAGAPQRFFARHRGTYCNAGDEGERTDQPGEARRAIGNGQRDVRDREAFGLEIVGVAGTIRSGAPSSGRWPPARVLRISTAHSARVRPPRCRQRCGNGARQLLGCGTRRLFSRRRPPRRWEGFRRRPRSPRYRPAAGLCARVRRQAKKDCQHSE